MNNSAAQFAQRLPIPQYLFHPSIDPLAAKNRELDAAEIQSVLEDLRIPTDKPIVTQVSRFDRFKDPVGVIRAFQIARRYRPCRLVLAGGGADDDPESALVLAETRAAAADDPRSQGRVSRLRCRSGSRRRHARQILPPLLDAERQ